MENLVPLASELVRCDEATSHASRDRAQLQAELEVLHKRMSKGCTDAEVLNKYMETAKKIATLTEQISDEKETLVTAFRKELADASDDTLVQLARNIASCDDVAVPVRPKVALVNPFEIPMENDDSESGDDDDGGTFMSMDTGTGQTCLSLERKSAEDLLERLESERQRQGLSSFLDKGKESDEDDPLNHPLIQPVLMRTDSGDLITAGSKQPVNINGNPKSSKGLTAAEKSALRKLKGFRTVP